jgi:Dyp-type peroxidase family
LKNNGSDTKAKAIRHQRLRELIDQRKKQPGVEFPKPGQQDHLLIVRLNIVDKANPLDLLPSPDITAEELTKQRQQAFRKSVHDGLINLLGFLDELHSGIRKLDELTQEGVKKNDIGYMHEDSAEKFNFSATIGFGIGFFDKLGIPANRRPKLLKSMPDHEELGDIAPYSLEQSDLIIQLGSKVDFINRWVYENNFEPTTQREKATNIHDIVSAIRGWAIVTDVHAGFQRLDGRNLMGFNDGVSNPNPGAGEEFDRFVWIRNDEDKELPEFEDGTYMVFQKIAHDLDQWRSLAGEEQEQWVGRDKVTGLLLGTPQLTKEFKDKVISGDEATLKELDDLLDEQSNPRSPIYEENKSIDKAVPTWSHVRKANPRFFEQDKPQEDKIIFRRGYLYTESGLNDRINSGLLFVCFQRNIEHKFEFIKKEWFGNINFPKLNTGREGLSGPSELGKIPTGQFLAIVPFGGGYYFVPPIQNKNFTEIAKPFFDFPHVFLPSQEGGGPQPDAPAPE